MERLQKVIAKAGIASRRKAETLISMGRVKVDGVLITDLGHKVGPKQEVSVDDVIITNEEKVYILLNKPMGTISSLKDEKGRKTVVDIIETDIRIYPVGRLDYNTTGAMILTNDGDFSQMLTHPKNKIKKVYRATVDNVVKAEHIIPLEQGITFKGIYYQPAKVKLRSVNQNKRTSILSITVSEGKNHQIKKMLQSVGLNVIKLKREKIGHITLEGLPEGQYRPLTKKEISKFYIDEQR